MGRAEEYRRRAEDAEKRAERALSPYERDQYRKIARGYRELQAEAERLAKRGV